MVREKQFYKTFFSMLFLLAGQNVITLLVNLADNMMLGAYAVGLGSCWIHRAKEVFSSAKGKELMKKWGVSDNYVGVGHCALGYAAGPLPEAAPRKPENIVRV